MPRRKPPPARALNSQCGDGCGGEQPRRQPRRHHFHGKRATKRQIQDILVFMQMVLPVRQNERKKKGRAIKQRRILSAQSVSWPSTMSSKISVLNMIAFPNVGAHEPGWLQGAAPLREVQGSPCCLGLSASDVPLPAACRSPQVPAERGFLLSESGALGLGRGGSAAGPGLTTVATAKSPSPCFTSWIT